MMGFDGMILILLVVFGAVALILRRKSSIPKSAPRGSRESRTAETVVLISAGLVVFLLVSCLPHSGVLLKLGQLRPELARAHVIVACCTAVVMVLAVLLTLSGRSAWATTLMVIVLCGYATMTKQTGFRPGPLTLIAPEGSFEPIVNYTFTTQDGLKGVEVWINGVYFGKTPVKITGREFHKKIPFLSEPPEGYSDKDSHQPKAHWFKVQLPVVETQKRGNGSIWYDTTFKDYFAKAKWQDEWAERGHGGGGGGGDSYRRDYGVTLSTYFSIEKEHRHQRERRLETLVRKAWLSDYQAGPEWFAAAASHGDSGWRKLRRLAERNEDFEKLLDGWARWKYGIDEDIDRDAAERVFERICEQADKDDRYNRNDSAGRAVELIFAKLDVERLVGRYEKILRGRGQGRLESVIHHAIRLWDDKLEADDPGKPNIVEQRIAPAFIVWRSNPEGAIEFGGPEVERYLFRQYQRDQRVSSEDINSSSREYHWGQWLNKWLRLLVRLDGAAGRDFLRQHRERVLEMGDLLVKNMGNHERKPPEFLFSDLDQGQNSMAWQYWPKYSLAVESSSPPWEPEKLKKRWAYLAKMGELATNEMYLDCWRQAWEKDKRQSSNLQLVKALREIPLPQRVYVGKKIIEDLDSIDRNFTVSSLRGHLVTTGDEESLSWWLSKLGPEHYDRVQQKIENNRSADLVIIEALANHDDPDLHGLAVRAIEDNLRPSTYKILQQLLKDPDEQVRREARKVADKLKAIENLPLRELVAPPKLGEIS